MSYKNSFRSAQIINADVFLRISANSSFLASSARSSIIGTSASPRARSVLINHRRRVDVFAARRTFACLALAVPRPESIVILRDRLREGALSRRPVALSKHPIRELHL